MSDTEIKMWCDGSGVPEGPGGYGVVLVKGGVERELSGGMVIATNNRAELMAAIKGLEALTRPCTVTIYTDSRYVSEAFTKNYIAAWKRKRWHKVKNPDLWKRLIAAVSIHPVVRWEWVKGHSGDVRNERCDVLAGEARIGIVEALKFGVDLMELDIEIEDMDYTEQMEFV